METIIQQMLDMIYQVGQFVVGLLPQSPFREAIDNFDIPGNINFVAWFIPVHDILGIFSIWLAAVTLFYAYSVILRWVKIIGD